MFLLGFTASVGLSRVADLGVREKGASGKSCWFVGETCLRYIFALD